jgi:hypothetical protein
MLSSKSILAESSGSVLKKLGLSMELRSYTGNELRKK